MLFCKLCNWREFGGCFYGIVICEYVSCKRMNKFVCLFVVFLCIDYFMLFEVYNFLMLWISYCGVLEFVVEEGMIYMLYWVCILFFLNYSIFVL